MIAGSHCVRWSWINFIKMFVGGRERVMGKGKKKTGGGRKGEWVVEGVMCKSGVKKRAEGNRKQLRHRGGRGRNLTSDRMVSG